MPLIFDCDFPIIAFYNIVSDGGAKIKGNADVEVVHNKTQNEMADNKNKMTSWNALNRELLT